LRSVEAELTSEWSLVLRGEVAFGPGNSIDLEYQAAHNDDATVWALEVTTGSDANEGFRDLLEDGDDDRGVTETIEVVLAVRVPAGTGPSAAVRRLLAAWAATADDRQVEPADDDLVDIDDDVDDDDADDEASGAQAPKPFSATLRSLARESRCHSAGCTTCGGTRFFEALQQHLVRRRATEPDCFFDPVSRRMLASRLAFMPVPRPADPALEQIVRDVLQRLLAEEPEVESFLGNGWAAQLVSSMRTHAAYGARVALEHEQRMRAEQEAAKHRREAREAAHQARLARKLERDRLRGPTPPRRGARGARIDR
jgi:hypothetical protein